MKTNKVNKNRTTSVEAWANEIRLLDPEDGIKIAISVLLARPLFAAMDQGAGVINLYPASESEKYATRTLEKVHVDLSNKFIGCQEILRGSLDHNGIWYDRRAHIAYFRNANQSVFDSQNIKLSDPHSPILLISSNTLKNAKQDIEIEHRTLEIGVKDMKKAISCLTSLVGEYSKDYCNSIKAFEDYVEHSLRTTLIKKQWSERLLEIEQNFIFERYSQYDSSFVSSAALASFTSEIINEMFELNWDTRKLEKVMREACKDKVVSGPDFIQGMKILDNYIISNSTEFRNVNDCGCMFINTSYGYEGLLTSHTIMIKRPCLEKLFIKWNLDLKYIIRKWQALGLVESFGKSKRYMVDICNGICFAKAIKINRNLLNMLIEKP